MVLAGTTVIFQYKTLKVLKFVQSLNAYEVQRCTDVQFIKYELLQDFHPLGVHSGFGENANKQFVTLRYRVDIMQ